MASTMASGERIWGTYVTDAPEKNYNISCKKALVQAEGNATKLGYTAGSDDQEGIPNELKPRRVKCHDSAGNVRWVICYDTSATLWTTAGTSIVLDFKGVDTTFTSMMAKRAERRGASISKNA